MEGSRNTTRDSKGKPVSEQMPKCQDEAEAEYRVDETKASEVTESADEEPDSSSVNRIQGQEPRRWWGEIKGSYGWRRTRSAQRERRG